MTATIQEWKRQDERHDILLLLARISHRLRDAPLHHLGPIAHGWTTMEPSTCDLCWVVDAVETFAEGQP